MRGGGNQEKNVEGKNTSMDWCNKTRESPVNQGTRPGMTQLHLVKRPSGSRGGGGEI